MSHYHDVRIPTYLVFYYYPFYLIIIHIIVEEGRRLAFSKFGWGSDNKLPYNAITYSALAVVTVFPATGFAVWIWMTDHSEVRCPTVFSSEDCIITTLRIVFAGGSYFLFGFAPRFLSNIVFVIGQWLDCDRSARLINVIPICTCLFSSMLCHCGVVLGVLAVTFGTFLYALYIAVVADIFEDLEEWSESEEIHEALNKTYRLWFNDTCVTVHCCPNSKEPVLVVCDYAADWAEDAELSDLPLWVLEGFEKEIEEMCAIWEEAFSEID